jgi:hypothetical protein
LNDKLQELLGHFDQVLTIEETVNTDGVDLNSHVDIFHSIYTQVLGTANEHAFLCILRHLLKLDDANKQSGALWELIEKLVCRATVFNKEENSLYTLERYTDEKLKSLIGSTESGPSQIPAAPPLPPPPPPAPPMPPSFLTSNKSRSIEEEISRSLKSVNKLTNSEAGNIKSGLSGGNGSNLPRNNSNENGLSSIESVKLPQQCVPKPHAKMKQLTWSKIHTNRIVGKENLWTKLKQADAETTKSEFKTSESERALLLGEDSSFFNEIEEFFKVSENPRAESQFKDPNLRETKNWHSSEKVSLYLFLLR